MSGFKTLAEGCGLVALAAAGLGLFFATRSGALDWERMYRFAFGWERMHFISLELRVSADARWSGPADIRLVDSESASGLDAGPETRSADGKYRLFASASDELIYPGRKRYAVIVTPPGELAQVFALPDDAFKNENWSPWLTAKYREKGEDAWYTFLYGLKNKDRVPGPAERPVEIRFRIYSRSRADVEKDYAAAAAERDAEKARALAAMRADVAGGRTDSACRLAATDPGATAADFELCRKLILTKTDPAERWRQFAFFLPLDAGDGVASWYNDELPGAAKETRDWDRKKVAVPEPEQAWFVGVLLETWLALDDASVRKTAYDLRCALEALDRGVQQWTPESRKALDSRLRARMIARLRRAGPGPDDPTGQVQLLIDRLSGRE